jgi:hypothetical protein
MAVRAAIVFTGRAQGLADSLQSLADSSLKLLQKPAGAAPCARRRDIQSASCRSADETRD